MRRLWMLNTICATAVAAALTWMSGVEQARGATFNFISEHSSGNYLGTISPPPANNSAGSGVAYWPDQDTYLILDNTVTARIFEFNRSHVHQRTINLTGFQDPEDIHWITNNTFVIAQERNTKGTQSTADDSVDELVVINIPTSGSSPLDISAATRRLQIRTDSSGFLSQDNKGIEAVTVIGDDFYFTTEYAPSSPASSWKLWRVANTGSGTVTGVTPTSLFSVSTLISGIATDISGLTTDGNELWFLSDESDRIIRATTGGSLITHYALPTTGGFAWNQPEGIELFYDTADNIMRLIVTGEVNGGAGVDFWLFKVPTVTIVANDASASETCTDPGTFRVTRSAASTAASLGVTYTISGSAINGTDYSTLTSPATIAASSLSTLVTVTPISATPGESSETVTLTFPAHADYLVRGANSDTVTIYEGDTYSWDAEDDGIGDRVANTVVYTGTDVIVWGGGRTYDIWLGDGARYNVASGDWTEISSDDAPAGRWWHTAVWTGTEMIVWGGRPSFYSESHYNDGGAYNPANNTWRAISTTGAPTGRSQMVSVWTGTEMIVWGGHSDGFVQRADGGAYNPSTDTWRSLANSPLDGRIEPTAVWTGTEMIVFGGFEIDGEVWNSFGDGARYNPTTDSWSTLSSSGAPSSRTAHTAVWTGNEMLIWGGRYLPDYTFLDTGARYNPANNTWTSIPTSGAPTARAAHVAVWSGTRMIVWGGYSDPSPVEESSGGEYSPSCNTWTATATSGAPDARFFGGGADAVWTSGGMFIHGGWDYPYTLNSTAMYRRN